MEKIERLTKDRNWIKFRLAGSLNALKGLPSNALSYQEKEYISNAINSIENVTERFAFVSQTFGIKSKKKKK